MLLRFEGELNVDLNEFQTNFVPFPPLHFITTALAARHSKEEGNGKQPRALHQRAVLQCQELFCEDR